MYTHTHTHTNTHTHTHVHVYIQKVLTGAKGGQVVGVLDVLCLPDLLDFLYLRYLSDLVYSSRLCEALTDADLLGSPKRYSLNSCPP